MRESDNDVSWKTLTKIVENTGMTLDEVTGYEKPKMKDFVANDTWERQTLQKEV